MAGTVALAALLVFAAGAQAATLTVNDLSDFGDSNPGDAACDTNAPAGVCTLRAAIQEANALGGSDQVNITATGTINLFSELPTISTPMDINGPGPNQLTVRRADGVLGNLRPFLIQSASVMGASLSGIKVTNGLSPQGGGVAVGGPVAATLRNVVIEGNASRTFAAQGGGIWLGNGSLRLLDSTVRNNLAAGEQHPAVLDGGSGLGGGIYSGSDQSSILIRGSTLSGNATTAANGKSVDGGPGGHGGSSIGGAILPFGDLHVESSTISGNTALSPGAGGGGGGLPGGSIGGGIAVWSEAASVFGSTVVGNAAADGSNIHLGHGAIPTLLLKSSLIGYGNGFSNCEVSNQVTSSAITSQGYNLSTDGSCDLDQGTDLVGDPQLGPLADNGGPTMTHALPKASAAIDRGIQSGILDSLVGPTLTSNSTDQRGRTRTFDFGDVDNAAGGAGADIGAFERQSDDATGGTTPPPPPPPPPPDPDPGPPQDPGGPSPGDPLDALDPSTVIEKGPKRKSEKATAKFVFGANEVGTTYECRLIGGGKRAKPPFKPCVSPKTYRRLDPGEYTFEVRATDAAGNVDESPAKLKFKVVND
jgi:CSLREA domain-containing protein